MRQPINDTSLEWALTSLCLIMLGALALTGTYLTSEPGLASVFSLGCLLIGVAGTHLTAAVYTRRSPIFFGHLWETLLYGAAGVYLMRHPAAAPKSLTLAIGLLFVGGGIYEALGAMAIYRRRWFWPLLHGGIDFLLALALFSHWLGSSAWIWGTVVGIDLLAGGWAILMLALDARATSRFNGEGLRSNALVY